MSSSLKHIYEFGEWRLDPAEHRLARNGEAVPISPKVFDTLHLLVENAGRLVTKDEFMQRVWPNVFVEDLALVQNISQIRKVLGQGQGAVIETVSKRGYRLIAGVRQVPQPVQEPALHDDTEDAIAGLHDARISASTEVTSAPLKGSWAKVAIPVGVIGITVVALLAVVIFGFRHGGRPQTVTIHSLAVLPLENLSGDPSQEYFSDGLTDELITSLARLNNLRVISRTSIMQYKGKPKPLPQIAKELGVDAIVEGTVARSGTRVRLRAQLILASADRHLWAQVYDRDSRDILTLQAELARDIAEEVSLELIPDQNAELASSHYVDPEAHELYLQGRYFGNKRTHEALNEAVGYFQHAIEKDPNYAQAYAGLGNAYVLLGGYSYIPQAAALPKARAAAERALQLNDRLAEAHTSLALIHAFYFNWEESRRHYRRALELSPNYATAHHWYGDGYLALVGQMDEAVSELRRAQELDPLSPVIATDLGKDLYLARRYDEAILQLHKALELDPGFFSARIWLEQTYLEQGLYAQARTELETARTSIPPSYYLAESAYVYARSGQESEARSSLAKLLRLSQQEYVNPGSFAPAYIALGQNNQAFFWLEKAYDSGMGYIGAMKVWPVYDPIRSDPRFHDLMHRAGLSG